MTAFLLLAATAFALDDSTLQATLDKHVSDKGRVDYVGLSKSKMLDPYITALATTTEPASSDAKKAFWINAYNALTMDLMADNWPVSSIMDLDGGKVWDTRKFTVAGKQVTLNDIEQRILRPMGDPRIHAAINCASIGCPPLYTTVFTENGLDAQLDAVSKRWMGTNGLRVDQTKHVVSLSKVFDWYTDDFKPSSSYDIPGVDDPAEAAANFAARYASSADAAFLKGGGYQTVWLDYNWKANSL